MYTSEVIKNMEVYTVRKFRNKHLASILVIIILSTGVFWSNNALATDTQDFLTPLEMISELEGKFGPDSDGNSSRLAGTDRYQTAVMISKQGWADKSSEFAVLSAGMDGNLVDALTSAPLAYLKQAPILLTEGDTLNTHTELELVRLGVTTVYVTSGIGVIKQNVITKLENEMGLTVIKLGGKDRFETAINTAQEMGMNVTTVAISTAYSNADALSMASIAAVHGMPILLSEVNRIPASVSDYLKTVGVQQSYVLGGEGVLSKSVENALPNPTRLGGSNRYETNSKIISAFSQSIKNDKVYLASGNNLNIVDALSGSSLAAKTSSAIVLVDKQGLNEATEYLVKDLMFPVRKKNLVALGGEAVVPQALVDDLGTVVQYLQDGAIEGSTNETVTVNHSIAAVGNGVTVNNVDTPYDFYVQGNNVALMNVNVGEALILNPGVDGKVSLDGVSAGLVIILSGSSQDGVTIRDSEIGMLIIHSISEVKVTANFDCMIAITSVLSNATLATNEYTGDLNYGTGFGFIIVGGNIYAPEVKFEGEFTNYQAPVISVIKGTVINLNTNMNIPSVVVVPDNKDASVTLQGLFGQVMVSKPINFALLGSNSSIFHLTIPSAATANLDGRVETIVYTESE